MMAELEPSSLPDKLYFKIGEVSEILGVEPYVLRYWETEFPALKPIKSRSQQRMYRKRDVELLLKIKKLLYEEMFTIAGAKRHLARIGEKGPSPQMTLELPESDKGDLLKKIEKELASLLKVFEDRKI